MPPLAARLKTRIEADGPLTVGDWMQVCLADPDHGYYMTRDPLGQSGDFTTSPEISQMFGELLGLWAAVVWQQIGSSDAVRLIELGPGRGTLMADALRALKGVPALAAGVHVHMVETSPVLRNAQEKTLSQAGVPVDWHNALDQVPEGPSIILGNEFLDALPIRQLVRENGAWHERRIGFGDGGFDFVTGELISHDEIAVAPEAADDGAIFEYSPVVREMSRQIAERVATMGGVALLIDYGHDLSGLGETLQAVEKHRYADPLAHPGACDLTAHVDFAAVGHAASDGGARVWGPIAQGELLERLGLAARAAALLAAANKAQAENIATARRRLVDADAMGRLFRAIAVTHPASPAPPGFETVSWA